MSIKIYKQTQLPLQMYAKTKTDKQMNGQLNLKQKKMSLWKHPDSVYNYNSILFWICVFTSEDKDISISASNPITNYSPSKRYVQCTQGIDGNV